MSKGKNPIGEVLAAIEDSYMCIGDGTYNNWRCYQPLKESE